ncbi:MAG: hypothetical protein LBJ71_02095 [Holosporaceae bacterium]|nr:hypothetical protein [Holosporaceae bacterium]
MWKKKLRLDYIVAAAFMVFAFVTNERLNEISNALIVSHNILDNSTRGANRIPFWTQENTGKRNVS